MDILLHSTQTPSVHALFGENCSTAKCFTAKRFTANSFTAKCFTTTCSRQTDSQQNVSRQDLGTARHINIWHGTDHKGMARKHLARHEKPCRMNQDHFKNHPGPKHGNENSQNITTNKNLCALSAKYFIPGCDGRGLALDLRVCLVAEAPRQRLEIY